MHVVPASGTPSEVPQQRVTSEKEERHSKAPVCAPVRSLGQAHPWTTMQKSPKKEKTGTAPPDLRRSTAQAEVRGTRGARKTRTTSSGTAGTRCRQRPSPYVRHGRHELCPGKPYRGIGAILAPRNCTAALAGQPSSSTRHQSITRVRKSHVGFLRVQSRSLGWLFSFHATRLSTMYRHKPKRKNDMIRQSAPSATMTLPWELKAPASS